MKKHDYKIIKPIVVKRRFPSNNFRKIHGEHMVRYKQLEKLREKRFNQIINKWSYPGYILTPEEFRFLGGGYNNE